VLVVVRYAGQDGPAYRMATNTEWLYQKLH